VCDLGFLGTEPDGLLRTNYSSVLTNVGAALHGFHDVMKDISKHYSQKATIEHELPTATQKLITTNDCILSSVVALTNGAGKPLLESVPYEEALANRRVLLSSTESREGLAQQVWHRENHGAELSVAFKVQQSLEKISKLEQEKEHWMLEAQLAKIKLEKENQRTADKLKSTSSGQAVGVAQEGAAVVTAVGQEDTSAKAVPEPVHSSSLVSAPDVDSREDLIRNHYMARIVELTSQLQLADSKSVHFYAEVSGELIGSGSGNPLYYFTGMCRALSRRLALAEKSKEALAEEMKVASQNVSRLQDELTTTKRSYEDQLSMMSDHLCSMNETLSKQREEIDTLKMSSKGNSKKNKSR
ncbi:hypothetical protein E2I00_009073, partial [Balaenoptera physalus]